MDLAGFTRRQVAREIHSEYLRSTISYLEAIPEAAETASGVICDSPVFVLSAGWRSGSTAVQRLVCSAKGVLVWGEPFENRVPVCRLARTLQGLESETKLHRSAIGNVTTPLTHTWIARLHPGVEALRPAHRAFFETLLAAPALRHGFPQWGAKWVRLTGEHALYLKWLYPGARFIFVVRNPVDAFRSYKHRRWLAVYPDASVHGVTQFIAHWRYLACSFLTTREQLGARLVRYEDLKVGAPVVGELCEYLKLDLDESVLGTRIGASDVKGVTVTSFERLRAAVLAGDVARELGYNL